MIPDDTLQLEEDLQTLLVPSELLVAEAKVVQGLDTRGIIVKSDL